MATLIPSSRTFTRENLDNWIAEWHVGNLVFSFRRYLGQLKQQDDGDKA